MTGYDLIQKIQMLGPEKEVILDDDGNTYGVDIMVWNENDLESPLAIVAT